MNLSDMPSLPPVAAGHDATLPPVIIGAGPAGVRAAQTLARHSLRPVLLDESPRVGGQIYRQPPAGHGRTARALYGFEAARATSVHHALDDLADRVDHRANTFVWGAQSGELHLMDAQGLSTLPYRRLIVATGATDRILPFAGWTLPGVYSLGGSQVALKAQGCAIGTRVVFAGTGPLLYLVAWQYMKAGVRVAAVLDTATWGDRMAALPAMLRNPAVLAKGLYYMGWLAAHGVPLRQGVRLLAAEGDTRVSSLRYADSRGEHRVECDGVGFGYALRSETQLADLLGCDFAFDTLQHAHLPVRDAGGRSSVAGVYLAGDGAGIMGADAAELAGERAALALLADSGVPVDAGRCAALERDWAAMAQFRRGLERAFVMPADWASTVSDDLVVCRCENVTAGTLRRCVADASVQELNRLKALTRAGMGRCQGRMCGAATAEILAHACGRDVADVGRLRAQAPIKPLPLHQLAGRGEGG